MYFALQILYQNFMAIMKIFLLFSLPLNIIQRTVTITGGISITKKGKKCISEKLQVVVWLLKMLEMYLMCRY